jgi:hypothetical protein
MTSFVADSPEAALSRFVAALFEQRWVDAAAMLEPLRAEQFMEEQRGYHLQRNIPDAMTIEQYRRWHPEEPESVAAWNVERHERSREKMLRTCDERFAHVTNEEELRALTPRELLPRWLEAQDVRYQGARILAERRIEVPDSHWKVLTRPREYEPIGHVRESDDVALVVFREVYLSEDGARSPGNAEVIALTRSSAGDWILPANHQLTLLNFGGLAVEEWQEGDETAEP